MVLTEALLCAAGSLSPVLALQPGLWPSFLNDSIGPGNSVGGVMQQMSSSCLFGMQLELEQQQRETSTSFLLLRDPGVAFSLLV